MYNTCGKKKKKLQPLLYYLVLSVPQQAGHSFLPTVLYSSPSLLGSSETFLYKVKTGNSWQSVTISGNTFNLFTAHDSENK